MKILVTGGLGFIGSNIVERLLKENHEVTIIDNLHSGSLENIESIKNKVKLFKMDAGRLDECGIDFDLIFHQGIYSSTPMYKENPHLMSSAISDWIKILEYARKKNIKVVYASTSSLYNGQIPPHKEDMPVLITDFYSEVRVFMERLAKLYDSLYGVKSVGLRYFSVYGPHEISKGKYANLISQFIWDLRANKSPVVYGDGTQTRDFTFVEDVVEANMLAMKYSKTDIFNVGTGKSITINKLLEILNKKLGKSIKTTYIINPLKNYVNYTQASTEKTEKILGFVAKTPLEKGIDKLLEYYRNK